LVVAYALAGRTDVDILTHPLGKDSEGNDVFFNDIWPTRDEIDAVVQQHLNAEMFAKSYSTIT
jgi:aconitate hydratase